MFGREEGHWCAAGMGMAATLFAWAEERTFGHYGLVRIVKPKGPKGK